MTGGVARFAEVAPSHVFGRAAFLAGFFFCGLAEAAAPFNSDGSDGSSTVTACPAIRSG
jgi:hypothetical protein